MPYDRKTELLWNYLSLAQFADLSRFWNQGPATKSSTDLSDWSKSPTITLRTAETPDAVNGNAPAYHTADPVPSAANDSPLLSTPLSEEPGDVHSHIAVAPYIPLSNGSHPSGGMMEVGGGIARGESGPSLHIISVTSVATTTTVQPTTASSANVATTDATPVVDAEPKIYGPSAVATSADIESSPNTQSNSVVNTLDATTSNGWSDAGSDHVGSIIDQMQNMTQYQGQGFVIDYVHGDMTSLTTIQQLNTIFNNDINTSHGSFSAPAGSTLGDNSLSQSVTSGNNALGNTTVLQGNADLANYDALVVTGDLTKINRIVQVNLIDDTDHNTVNAHADISTPYGTASSIWEAAIQSGGNVEINVGFIIDNTTGAVYLVGGTYGTFASATQVNMLSNSDINDILALFHSQEGTGFLGFSTDNVIRSGGDSQSNMAGFLGDQSTSDGSSSSADSGHGSAGTPSDIMALLAFANLHATQADGNIHVLFVDGNYTIVNLVIQINVIHDADQNTLNADATGATGALAPPPDPVDDTTSTGQHDDGSSTTDGTSHSDPSGSDQTAHASDTDNAAHVSDGVSGDQTETGSGTSAPSSHNTDTPETTATVSDHAGANAAGAADSTSTGTGDTITNGSSAGTDGDHTDHTATAASSGTDTEAASNTDADNSTAHANDTGTENDSDNTLPVYNDHSSLNYDQIAASGGNNAGNHATILDGGAGGPQLVIVQGHYYEYNEIYQVNVLMDSDHNTITSTMNAPIPTGGDHTDGVQDSSHLTTADDVLKTMTG